MKPEIKNNVGSAFVADGIKNNKKFLFVALVAAIVTDAVAAVALIASGTPLGYWISPLVAFVADIVAVVLVSVSNCRFKYSVFPIILFSAIAAATTALQVVMNFYLLPTAMTVVSGISVCAVHLISVVCVIVCYLFAAKRYKWSGLIQTVIAVIFSAVAVLGALYGAASIIGNGYFGQGSIAYRAPVYEYDEDSDTYFVSGVLDGTGSRLMIPETFNGVKVSGVDCGIFAAEGVGNVTLSDPSVKLKNFYKLKDIGDLLIDMPKASIDEWKRQVYERAARDGLEGGFVLANSVYPNDVSAKEVFVTFAYDFDSYSRVNGNVLPTFIADKGEKFDISVYEDEFDYIRRRNTGSESDLRFNFDASDGYIMSDLKSDDGSIQGKELDKNVMSVRIAFEKIYRVAVGEDNDTLYEPPQSFKSFENTNFRYVTESSANALLGELKRDGFDLAWEYGEDKIGFTDFGAVLNQISGFDVMLYPKWKLRSPTLSELTTNAENDCVVYGENLTMSVTATAPASGIDLSYSWVHEGTELSRDAVCSVASMPWTGGGMYMVAVTASGSGTSLKSTRYSGISITVNKREVELLWSGDGSHLYDSNDKSVSCEVDDLNVINGDEVSVSYDAQRTFGHVGTYTVGVSLSGKDSEKYTIKGEKQKTLSITPAPITVAWSNTSLRYNGTAQAPTATPSGSIGTDDIGIAVRGGQKNANLPGETYTATAVLSNSDYEITEGASTEFAVTKAPITVAWSDTALEYNGLTQVPTATPSGVIGADNIGLSVRGGQRNANVSGGTYTATVSLSNANYEVVSGQTQSFTVSPKPVNFVWDGETAFVYTGSRNHPRVTAIEGYIDGAFASKLTYSPSGASVGVGPYSVTAALNDTNYKVENQDGAEQYTITPAPIRINWSDSPLTYNGQKQIPGYTVTGTLAGDDIGLVLSDGFADAGTGYVVNASITNSNYEVVSGESKSFGIQKKSVQFVWENATAYVYDRNSHHPAVTSVSGYIGSDFSDKISYSVSGSDGTGINVGSYNVSALLADGNYNVTNAVQSRTFRITPAPITVVWSNLSFTFDNNEHIPAATAGGALAGDDIGFTIAGRQRNAGSYTASASITDSNYEIVSGESIGFTILKKAVSFDWENKTEYIYNGKAQFPKVVSVGGYFGDFTEKLAYSDSENVSVGHYSVKATLNDGNYTVTNADTAKGYSITQRTLTVSFPTELTLSADGFTGEDEQIEALLTQINYSVAGAVSGEDVSALVKVDYETERAEGEGFVYTVRARLTVINGNYSVSAADFEITLTVETAGGEVR